MENWPPYGIYVLVVYLASFVLGVFSAFRGLKLAWPSLRDIPLFGYWFAAVVFMVSLVLGGYVALAPYKLAVLTFESGWLIP